MEQAGLQESLRNEVRLMFRAWRLNGHFSYSVDRIEFTYGGYARKRLKRFLDDSGIVEMIDFGSRGYIIGRKCKRYVFRLDGILPGKNRCPTDMEDSVLGCREPVHLVRAGFGCKVLIPSTFFRARCMNWVAACKKFGWQLRADWRGVTDWGAGLLSGLASICLPSLKGDELMQLAGDDAKGKWWVRYFRGIEEEASSFAVRIRSRCYHALTSCPRALRNMLTVEFRGETERLVAVDMSATYTAILVGQMWDSPERKKLEELLATKEFYRALNEGLPENLRYIDYSTLKQEYQKQCLFWRDARLTERPLWQALQAEFPQLAYYIESLRKRLGASGLSDFLTEKEANLFVDNMVVQCHKSGIPCVSVHDAVLVPASVAEQVKSTLEQLAKAALGFVPGFKIA